MIGGDGKTAISVPPESWLASLVEDTPRAWIAEIKKALKPDGSPIFDQDHELNFLGLLGAETTFLGIPVSNASTDLSFKLPSTGSETISKVRIVCGSLGLRSDNEWDPTAAWIGIALTAIIDLAIPAISLCFTVGTASNSLFDTFLKSVGAVIFWVATVVQTFLTVKDIVENPDMAGKDLENLLIGLADTVVQKIITTTTVAEQLAEWFGGEEFAEAVPIIGWAFKAEVVEATIEQLAQTVGEIVGSPRVVEFDVTITMDAKLTLLPSEKGGFPSRTHHYTITAQYTEPTGLLYTAEASDPKVDSIVVTWEDIPVGGTVTFLVSFYSSEGWLIGKGQSDSIANVVTPGQGALVVPPITITELLYPLTDKTTYGHQQILQYRDNVHQWIESTTAPVETAKDLSTGDAPHALDALTSIALNSELGVLGYSWEASGQNVPIIGTTEPLDEVAYTFQNISFGPTPEAALMFTPAGYSASPLLAYLRSALAGPSNMRAFLFLDPVADAVDGHHLRGIAPVTDPSIPPSSPKRLFDLSPTMMKKA